MKIAYLSFNLFPSHYAHTVQILKMCQAFKNLNYDVTLFAQKSENYTSDVDLFNNYLITNPFHTQWMDIPKNKWLHTIKIFWVILWLGKKFDLFYTRNILTAFYLVILNRGAILELHNIANSKIERILLPFLLKSNIKMVTISAMLAKYFAKQYNCSDSRFIIQHDAYDMGELKQMQQHGLMFPQKTDQKYIVYVGSFYIGRGIEHIIKLAQIFPNHYFICIGGKKEEIEKISNSISNIHNLFLFQRVEHSKIPSILRDADILLMPYGNKVTIEGKGNTSQFMSPMKMGEYLAAGKPILASSCPSLIEILHNNENSILCEPDDIEDWESKLNSLLNDNLLHSSLSRNAKNTAQKLTWENRVKNILKHD